MTSFPKKIKFLSTGEILEMEELESEKPPTRLSHSMRGKPISQKITKANEVKKMTYRYISVPSVRGLSGNKLGTTIEFDIEYLSKIDSFNGLEY